MDQCFFFLLSIAGASYLRVAKVPSVYYGQQALGSKRIVEKCKKLTSVYYPAPLWNRHLVLIPYMITGWFMKYVSPPFQWYRELITLPDEEVVALDWVTNGRGICNGIKSSGDDTPIVMLHHGAYCDSKDMPGQDYILQAQSRGWLVCVLNRRGHGGLTLTVPKWNFFGSTGDVAYIVKEIIRKRRPNAKLLMVGFSAGSGLVAKFLGEYPDVLSAAVGVCPGYDIEKCMGRFAYPYQMLLLYLGNLFFLDRNKSLLENVKGYHECKKADDLQKWLSSAHKMAGYTSAEEYYDNCNPMRTVDNIKNPCLFINSEDDPLCVEQNVIESLDDIYRSEHCIVCVTKTGSHLPFYEGLFFNSWATHATYEFFDVVLKEEEEVHIRF